jgi:hypothetical protein
MKARDLGWVLKRAVAGWWNDNVPRLGASLAYYTLFALAPILIVAIAIAGIFFGPDAVQREVTGQIRGLVGESGARAVQAMLQGASQRTGNGVAPGVRAGLGGQRVSADLSGGGQRVDDVGQEGRFAAAAPVGFGSLVGGVGLDQQAPGRHRSGRLQGAAGVCIGHRAGEREVQVQPRVDRHQVQTARTSKSMDSSVRWLASILE